jgi:hypothetical protein
MFLMLRKMKSRRALAFLRLENRVQSLQACGGRLQSSRVYIHGGCHFEG